MNKFISLLISSAFLFSFASCSNNDDDIIWDYVPVVYEFYVHNVEGRNLLDPATEGNILDQEIYIIRNGERIDAEYGWQDPIRSRALPTTWYGVFIAPAFNPYGPDMGNAIYIGEFKGSENKEEFELMICGNSYEIKFSSHIKKGGDLEREYYFNGFKMSNTRYFITVDEDLKDINYYKQ